MTIQELLDCNNPEDLEKITDEEWEKTLKPFFNITRPNPDKIKDNKAIFSKSNTNKAVSNSLIAQIKALNDQFKKS